MGTWNTNDKPILTTIPFSQSEAYKAIKDGFKPLFTDTLMLAPTADIIYRAMEAGDYTNLKLKNGTTAPTLSVDVDEISPDSIYDRIEFRYNFAGDIWQKAGVLKTPAIDRLNTRDLADGTFAIADPDGNVALAVLPNGTTYLFQLNTTIQPKIYGKKISILADSITTDNGGGDAGLVYPQQYWAQLEVKQACQVFRNAIAGTTIANGLEPNPFHTPSRWQSLNSEFEPEVILIFGGINDFLQDVTVGSPSDTTVSTFYGALDYLYKALLNRYPNARIFHMTPLHTKYVQGGGLVPEFNGSNYLTDYIAAINVVARRYGVGIIDTNQNSGITCYNIDSLSGDLIHIREEGHAMVYNTIISETNNKL